MKTIKNIHGVRSAERTGRHVLKRILAALAVATCMLDASAANQNPTVTMQRPISGSIYAAPATIPFHATADDSDGRIVMVEFFNGKELIATSTYEPYHHFWTGMPAGTYTITARATDDLGYTKTTPPSTVTVTNGGPQVYYVYSDQINTAKEITNSAGKKVWQSDSEPFGANPPMENPTGLGQFSYNLRFPGQYFDRETGLHYNYYRDYDPQTGRYVQSDPIGLRGGINTYSYVESSPLKSTDRFGLQSDPGYEMPRPKTLPGAFDVLHPGTQANQDFGRAFWRLFKPAARTAPGDGAGDDGARRECLAKCEAKFIAMIPYCNSMYGPGGIAPNPESFENCKATAVADALQCNENCFKKYPCN